ncbi:MAG: type II secretion system protein [Verrucomicrobiota bacterium]
MNPTQPRLDRRAGFTIVELLVAMGVLAVLGLIIVQIISLITQSTRISTTSVDTATQARLVFDRMGLDLETIIKRSDVDFRLDEDIQATTADGRVPLMTFLAQVASPDPASPPSNFRNRGISLLSYTVEPHPANQDRLCLVRAAQAISWNDPEFLGLDATGLPVRFRNEDGSTDYAVEITEDEADILSPAVLHAIVGVQLFPDNEPVYFEDDQFDQPTIQRAQGQVVYQMPMRGPATDEAGNRNPDNEFADLDRVAAFVVGLVMVDLEALAVMDASDASQVAGLFNTVTPNEGVLPVTAWLAANDDLRLGYLEGQLPNVRLPVLQSLRVYQRFFPVNPYGSKKR